MSKHARRVRGRQLQAGNAMRRLWFVVLLCSLAFPRWASANDIAPGGTLRAVYLGSNPAQAVRDRATGAIRGASADLARELGLDLPLARATKEQYDRMIAEGLGELDKSGIAELTFKGRHKHSGDRV